MPNSDELQRKIEIYDLRQLIFKSVHGVSLCLVLLAFAWFSSPRPPRQKKRGYPIWGGGAVNPRTHGEVYHMRGGANPQPRIIYTRTLPRPAMGKQAARRARAKARTEAPPACDNTGVREPRCVLGVPRHLQQRARTALRSRRATTSATPCRQRT